MHDQATLVGPWQLFDSDQACIGGYFSGYGSHAFLEIENWRHNKHGGILPISLNPDWEHREATINITGVFRVGCAFLGPSRLWLESS